MQPKNEHGSGRTRSWNIGAWNGTRCRHPRKAKSPVAPSPSPALSVHGLSRHFGDRVAFQDVSFEIGHGEVFGFLGPNGAGKTTMVRTLWTLLSPTSGSATVAGIPLTSENGVEIRRRISIMPESPGLYLRLSVTENLECFADLYEAPHPHDRIGRALRAVNLTDRANDACGTLSKGLRQRVASLPTAVLAALVAFDVIHPALGAAATWAQLQRMRTCLRHCSTRPGWPSVVISSARFHRLR